MPLPSSQTELTGSGIVWVFLYNGKKGISKTTGLPTTMYIEVAISSGGKVTRCWEVCSRLQMKGEAHNELAGYQDRRCLEDRAHRHAETFDGAGVQTSVARVV